MLAQKILIEKNTQNWIILIVHNLVLSLEVYEGMKNSSWESSQDFCVCLCQKQNAIISSVINFEINLRMESIDI